MPNKVSITSEREKKYGRFNVSRRYGYVVFISHPRVTKKMYTYLCMDR